MMFYKEIETTILAHETVNLDDLGCPFMIGKTNIEFRNTPFIFQVNGKPILRTKVKWVSPREFRLPVDLIADESTLIIQI